MDTEKNFADFKNENIGSNVFSKMFLWMFVGLLTTFVTGFYVSTNENMLYNIFSTSLYWFIFIAELLTVVFLSARLHKMSKTTAIFSFVFYSFLTGLTFSSIFVLFEISSIIYVFLATAIVFGVFAFFGFTTKMDLTKIGNLLLMGLLAIIVASLINIFIGSEPFDLVLNIVGIVIFIGYIAYDIQKVKRLNGMIEEDKLAIYGALELYLDFINLFIRLIQIFGKNRD